MPFLSYLLTLYTIYYTIYVAKARKYLLIILTQTNMHTQILSRREKVLAAFAGSLLFVLAFVGYADAQSSGATASSPTPATTSSTPATPSTAPAASSGASLVPPPPTTPAPALPSTNPQEQERQRRDQQNFFRGQLDNVKNIRREISDIKRDTKDLNTVVVEENLNKYETCLKNQEPHVGTGEFWQKQRDCDDLIKLVNDEMQDKLRPIRDCYNTRRNFQDRKRERKDIDRNLQEILRNDKNADVTQARALLEKMDAIFTKAEPFLSGTCTRDGVEQLNTWQRDLNDFFRDYYDSTNVLMQKSNDARRRTEGEKDFKNNIQRQCERDMGREVKNKEKDIERLQKSGNLPAGAEEAFKKLKALYTQLCVTNLEIMKQALEKGNIDTFESARKDFYDSNRDFWDANNEIGNLANIQEQLKNVGRELKQREKELVQMKKEMERAAKKLGAPDSAQKKLVDDYEALLNKAKEAVKTDPQSWWQEYQRELNDIQNDFWQSQQKVQFRMEGARWLKDLERDVLFREKDLRKISKEADNGTVKRLEELLGQMKGVLKKAQDLVATDPDQAQDALRSMDDLRFQWDETTKNFWDQKQTRFEFENIRRELEFADKQLGNLVRSGKISKEQTNLCRQLIDEARKILDQGQREGVFQNLQDLEERGRQACPFLEEHGSPPPDHAYYENFFEQHLKDVEIDKSIGAEIIEKISNELVNKVLSKLLSDRNAQNLLQVAGQKYQKEVATTLESAAGLYTNEAAQKELIAKKAEILQLTKQLEEVQTQLKLAQDKLKELQALQREIAAYNFYGTAGEEISKEIEEFVANAPNFSKEEIARGIQALKSKKVEAVESSKEAKLEAGVIPFRDTDDNEWFTKFVAPLARVGIVAGKGEGRFDPGAQVTVAEALTMAFRISGDTEVDEPSTLCNGKFKDHWGNKFIRWAEGRGLSITKACTDVNRPALRWELAQILLETATNGSLPETDKECFGDVKPSDKKVNAAVCAAQERGVMKGTDGKANAYGKLNRGEAATMVKQAAEKLFGMKFEVEEPKNGGNGGREMRTPLGVPPPPGLFK